MATSPVRSEVEYPESDGQPIGETDLHRDWMIRIFDLLVQRYRDQPVYVSSDLLLYYVEGVPHRYVVPDVFVVKEIKPGRRRIYKLWEEGKSPNVIFEVTSRSTRREDELNKPKLYADLGVNELFLYDPTSEYLLPPLIGYRLRDDAYERIEPNLDGWLASLELGVLLRLEAGRLVMKDAATGEPARTEAKPSDWLAKRGSALRNS